MCRWLALLLGLLSGLLVGCAATQPVRSLSWLDRFRISGGPKGGDVLVMDVALIERPVGDRFLNEDLWLVADEPVAVDRKAMLEYNGFRVCQIGGVTPPQLQALLTSERSCANPRRIQLHAGKPRTLVLGPATSHLDYQVYRDGQKVPVALEQAQCTLTVVPTLTKNKQIRLQFTPEVQHGESALVFQSAADRSGWLLQEQRPLETYSAMSWEVTLWPNEYVVVGGRFDLPETLGHQSFIRTDEPAPVQRLLVIRTTHLGGPPDFDSPTSDDLVPRRTAPIALQAGYTTARGISQ